jgi:hypothetical protein
MIDSRPSAVELTTALNCCRVHVLVKEVLHDVEILKRSTAKRTAQIHSILVHMMMSMNIIELSRSYHFFVVVSKP